MSNSEFRFVSFCLVATVGVSGITIFSRTFPTRSWMSFTFSRSLTTGSSSAPTTLSQFYRHFTSSFFVQKCFAQIYSTYLQFGFVILDIRILAQKLLLKCWWNSHLESISPTIYKQFFYTFPFATKNTKKWPRFDSQQLNILWMDFLCNHHISFLSVSSFPL